jgi:hypothetical protein
VAWVVMLVSTSEQHWWQKAPRPALNSLVDWLRAPKENLVFEAHYWPRQLFIRARPTTRMSSGFGKSGFSANERAQKTRTTRL